LIDLLIGFPPFFVEGYFARMIVKQWPKDTIMEALSLSVVSVIITGFVCLFFPHYLFENPL
jgi:hypothetical protein